MPADIAAQVAAGIGDTAPLPVEEVDIDIAAAICEGGFEGGVAHFAVEHTGGGSYRTPAQIIGSNDCYGVESNGGVSHLEAVAFGNQRSFATVGFGRMPCVDEARGVALQ